MEMTIFSIWFYFQNDLQKKMLYFLRSVKPVQLVINVSLFSIFPSHCSGDE